MPLLNKRLLQDNVTKHKHEIASDKKQALKELFQETLSRIENSKFKKEESEKVPFLQRLFELLGYKLHENLEFEYSTSFGRSIDGVLGLQSEKGRDVEIAIEWKGIDTKNLDGGKAGETPVSQMCDYMGKMNVEFGIIGNFLEWRLYSKRKGQTEYQEFKLQEIVENREKLVEMIFLLSPQTLLKLDKAKSEFEELIDNSISEQEQINKRFYEDYKQRRSNLFEHLIACNEDKNKHFLLEKTQKILDRLIFVLFCEDRFLLPANTFKETFELGKRNRSRSQTKIWEQFQYLFEDIDKGRYDIQPHINAFNGGLFSEDLELNSLVIKDDIWQDLVKFSDYDFESELDVDVLGHIFEQSISDIEEIKAEIDSSSSKPSASASDNNDNRVRTFKRKKDGIYYTPEYITDYIVSETVGGWLVDQEKKQDKINQHNQNIEFLKKEIKEKKINNLQNFKIEFFASSQCNDLYLITKNDKKYLARITNWEQNKVWKIKQEEYEKLNFIKDLNIAPISHYYDLGQNEKQIHWSLVDFVEGETVQKLSDKNIVQLAQTLKKLHENTIKNKYGDRWFELEELPYKSYTLKEYSKNKAKLVEKIGYDKLKRDFENINWAEIKQFCLIHNDLKPLNMVENNGEILLIDWEYAYMDIPENDIARFFVENSLTEDQKKLFLENYLPLENLDFKMEILETFVNLYEFFEVRKDVVETDYNTNLNTVSNPLQNIKILDPAGGSGAFPNQAFNFLTKKWVQKMNQIAVDSNLETLADFDEISIDKSILKNNIFMVDLQPESVEIAKLSLWLKTAKKDQKLNNLDENVKVGNSLIDDPEIAGDKAFDWEKEFGWLKDSGKEK